LSYFEERGDRVLQLNARFPAELLTWLRAETKSTEKDGDEAARAQKQLAQFGSDAERQQARQENDTITN
jgi:hypothetical protein